MKGAGDMNIDEMPAGREIDALIEKYVFNKMPKCGCFADDTYNGECVGADNASDCLLAEQKLKKQKEIPGDCKYWRTKEPESYSTDIAAAWSVVEKMHSKNFYLRYFYDGRYGCYFTEPPREVAYGETAPLAICRAALKAVGASL